MAPSPEDELDASTVAANPYDQFGRWYEDARRATDDKAGAMTVATATPDGRPSARIVLLRGLDERGFVFYTSYDSRKAGELTTNPHAAAVFYWPELDRQVRIEGLVARVTTTESEAYFAARPRGHRVGAWASPQSRPIPDRAFLERRLAEVEARFDGVDDVPLPDFWGGYRIEPAMFEFWCNRSDRLHDRIRYRRDGSDWVIERLAP